MSRQLILFILCSSVLIACGKKGYPSPEKLSNQEIIDILTKEIGAGRVNGIKLDARSQCILKARGDNARREKCMGDENSELRDYLINNYNTYVLNKSM